MEMAMEMEKGTDLAMDLVQVPVLKRGPEVRESRWH
jgi:hypothetical protein